MKSMHAFVVVRVFVLFVAVFVDFRRFSFDFRLIFVGFSPRTTDDA